jgi:outer membrane biosynthesis protein TonB
MMKRNPVFPNSVPGIALLILATMASAACKTKAPIKPTPPPQARSGEVSESIIESDASSRYVIESGMSYESPIILGDYPLPEYPTQQLAARLPPVEVTVRIVVASDGLVTRIDPLGTVDESTRAFYDATALALSKWEFAPFRIIEDSTGFARELPFHQDYRFVFRQVDGVPQVKQQ